ncbi:hypothetical protein [Streptomyces sp. A012304]|uniref:hypothetical protein n=1 Tax=Streptomyces sp. A012304 TaxID=375446 RepID=UPI00222F6F6D|nr:hypothetical protein [Streptomyces sp. A012304]GKQ35081.1 hypothetical protein ALMP_16270 [Streptomyces sp. A012304]
MLTGIRAGARGLAAAALTAAALLSPGLTAPAQAADSAPCTRDPNYPSLFRCPMWGTDINMRLAPDPNATASGKAPDNGYILADCQVKGGRATYGGYWHTWWVRSPASGMAPTRYMSEIFLVGGGNDEPDSGLPVC